MGEEFAQVIRRGHAVALGAVAFGILHKVGVSIGQAEIDKAHIGLLPADHPVSIIAQDQHGEIEPEAHRRLHLLAVHHEPAIAADRHHLACRVKHRAHHRGRQARAHCRQRIVEQHGVGEVSSIAARKPDLVDPIIEADDPVMRHRVAHLLDKVRREDREAGIGGERAGVIDLGLVEGEHVIEIPAAVRADVFLDLPHRVGDIADHFDLREVDRIDLGGAGRDVDHGDAVVLHEERRLFDHVVADINDAIRRFDRAVHEVARRQCGAAEELGVAFVDHALAHLGGQERDAGLFDQLFEHPPAQLAVGARADHQHRVLGRLDRLDRSAHRLGLGRGTPRDALGQRLPIGGGLLGDILGQFDQGRARLFLFGEPVSFAHAAGDVVTRRDLDRVLGDRLHQRDDIDDLEAALLRFLDRLLPGDHQHRHSTELGIGRRGHEICRPRAERGDAHASAPGVAAIGRGHEACALFVAGEDQLDLLGARQRIEEIEVFFAGNAENVLAALSLKTLDENVRCFLGIAHFCNSPQLHCGARSARVGPVYPPPCG